MYTHLPLLTSNSLPKVLKARLAIGSPVAFSDIKTSLLLDLHLQNSKDYFRVSFKTVLEHTCSFHYICYIKGYHNRQYEQQPFWLNDCFGPNDQYEHMLQVFCTSFSTFSSQIAFFVNI